ncbi:RING-H2 finger protein ATL16 [Heracleum sosnowskyi]|uniref:RING-type E3 ubiquitin transferase n=1 Tax=Heracleum sosnowskyi TaxID=360622 RepID=A0AAD8I8F5_9APIA|nr:RING-H2 finger protein ATL16 [Heracleum sosnowskyi]
MSMDLMSMNIHVSQSMSQAISPPSPSHLHSSHNGFPIIVIAIIGILATAFLLLSYYIFVIKCCLNWQRIDILGRFSLSRSRRREDLLMGYATTYGNRGLDESVIRSIPIFQFKKVEKEDAEMGNSFVECAVCLNEFHEQEKLRMIPNCGHLFHIDCIDVWLQNNANCPLCRTSISFAHQFPPLDQERPSSAHQDQVQYHDNFMGREEDYVVIELAEQENNPDGSLPRIHETKPSSPSQKKLVPKMVKKRSKKDGLRHTSMGDECIDTRVKDERLVVQPIRRSFSMDSAADRQLYLAVQEIVNQKSNGPNVTESVSCEACCSSKFRRSIFSFGHGRGSRKDVLPIELETIR